jgi:hypothetical protein
MKFTFIFSVIVLLCCLICSQGSSNNENKKNEVVVDVHDEFAFVEPLVTGHESSSVKSSIDGKKNMKPGIAGFFERLFEASKRNPLLVVLVFVLMVKTYLSSGKVKHIEGSLVRHINAATEWNNLMDESKKEGKLVVVDFFATW